MTMLTRLIIATALLLGLSGCLQQRSMLSQEEGRRVAWYVEDVAHGLERRPGELAYEAGSEGLDSVATWAAGDLVRGEQVAQPKPLEARRKRWPLLAKALGEGILAIDSAGLLRVDVSTAEAVDPILRDAMRAENIDRATTVDIVLGMGKVPPDSRRASSILSDLIEARLVLGQAAGGRRWSEPTASSSESNSASEATTSSSDPDPAPTPRRAP
jgi:hypothetical protein